MQSLWECHGHPGWQVLQLCQPQPLCGTESAALASLEIAKGSFGDHMFKGSMGHGALGGAVLYKGQN